MTPEDRARLMTVKPPEDVIVELSNMTSEGLSLDKVKELFYTTLKEEYLDGFTDINDRCRNASKVVLAGLASKAGQQPEPFELRIFDKTSIKTITKKDGTKQQLAQVFGIGAPSKSETGPKMTTVVLWNEAAQLVEKFQVGKSVLFKGLIRDGNEYSVALFEGHVPGFELEEIKLDVPSPIEMVRKAYKELSISEVGQNVSEKGETRLVRGRVASGRINLSKKNNMQIGHLNLINPSATLKDMAAKVPGTEFHVSFNDEPAMVTRYETGSDVLVLCVITNNPQYGISGLGKLIIPIFAIPKKQVAPPQSSQPASPALPASPTGTQNIVRW